MQRSSGCVHSLSKGKLGESAVILAMGSKARTWSRMIPSLLAITHLPRRGQLSATGLGPGRSGARQEFGFRPLELEGPIRPPSGEGKKACGWIRSWSSEEAQVGHRYLKARG